jgi:hypothetical protein
MDCLAVRKGYHPQVLAHLCNEKPMPDATIRLNFPTHRVPHGIHTPFAPDIWAFTQDLLLEIPGGDHGYPLAPADYTASRDQKEGAVWPPLDPGWHLPPTPNHSPKPRGLTNNGPTPSCLRRPPPLWEEIQDRRQRSLFRQAHRLGTYGGGHP